MKKSLVCIAALAFVAFAACKSGNKAAAPADTTDYIAKYQQTEENIRTEYMAIATCDSLELEVKQEKISKLVSDFEADVKDMVEKAFAAHQDDSVAVFMVNVMMQNELATGAELLAKIESLGPNVKADKTIQRMMKVLGAEAATAQGCKFVDFEIPQPDGKVARLSDYAGNGKYCLVDFWASWCGPCKGEIPNIRAAFEKYAPKGLNVLSVAVWDKVEDTQAAAKAHGITWNQIVDAQRVPTDLYGINGIPQIMLIGPDGTILKRDLRGEGIEEELSKYF